MFLVSLIVFLLLVYFSMYRQIRFGRLIPYTSTEKELQNILRQDYPKFVEALGQNINDPKFVALIRYLGVLNKIEYRETAIRVKDLLPTQNEIDMNASLKFPLTVASNTEQYLKGGIIAVAGKRVVTANGRFVIDGHHRWSQLYVINPNAQIEVLDMVNISDPIAALKAVQLGIAGDLRKIPTANVQGTNLLRATPSEIKAFVSATITPEVTSVFEKFMTIASIEDYIVRNCQMMQTNNLPVLGAPSRDIMPQTDNATQWRNYAFV